MGFVLACFLEFYRAQGYQNKEISLFSLKFANMKLLACVLSPKHQLLLNGPLIAFIVLGTRGSS